MDEKYNDDVQKLIDMGKDNKFLSYDEINNEIPEGPIAIDDIEDILGIVGNEGISIGDSQEQFFETAASSSLEKKEDQAEEERAVRKNRRQGDADMSDRDKDAAVPDRAAKTEPAVGNPTARKRR